MGGWAKAGRIALALVVALAAAAAGVAGVGYVGQALESGALGPLALGLALCGVVPAVAGVGAWRIWEAVAGEVYSGRYRSSEARLRVDVITSGLAMPVEGGLGVLTPVLAGDGHTGSAWLTGGVGLVVLAVWLFRLCGRDFVEAFGFLAYAALGALTVTAGSAALLAVGFAVDGRPVPAILLGCVLLLVLAAALWLRRYDSPRDLDRGGAALTLVALGFVAAAGLGGVAARLALDGGYGMAALAGVPALVLLLVSQWWLKMWAATRVHEARQARLAQERGMGEREGYRREEAAFRAYRSGSDAGPYLYEQYELTRDIRYQVTELRDQLRNLEFRGPAYGRQGAGRSALSDRDLDRLTQQIVERLTARLTEQLASRLADRIAESVDVRTADRIVQRTASSTTEQLGARVERVVGAAISTTRDDLREVMRASVEELVIGPPPANFAGFLSLQLDARDTDDRTGPAVIAGPDGTVRAPAGRRLRLVLTVARDGRARDLPGTQETGPEREFFVFEPVRIEGGREVDTVEFEAVADSSALTPLPQRRPVRVGRGQEVQSAFAFQLPDREGQYEVWFQLYQSGRLVQALAVTVESTLSAPPEAPAAPEALA